MISVVPKSFVNGDRSNYPNLKIEILNNRNLSLKEMLKTTTTCGSDTLVLFYSWFNRDSTNLASLQYIMAYFERNKVRVLAMQEPILWSVAVGGVFTLIEPVGLALGAQVKTLLSGTPASQLDPESLPVAPTVNYEAVKTGIISAANIPENTTLINAPILLRPEDRKFFYGACGLIALFVLY